MGIDRKVAWLGGKHQYAGRCSATADALSATCSHAERRWRGISAGGAAKSACKPVRMTISKACRSAILNPAVARHGRALTLAQPNSKPQTDTHFTPPYQSRA